MIRDIVRDVLFLSQPSEPAAKKDRAAVRDLLDTLKANSACCAGMAANMIGVNKRIIAVNMGRTSAAMINPVITEKRRPYAAEEGCLSLDGVRPVTRYEEITVEYFDENFRKQRQKFSGFTAQIIQHECDHLDGIII